MNNKAMGLSLVMAGIAVFFVISTVTSMEEDAKKEYGEKHTVLVAKADIKEMDTIQDSMVESKEVPKNYVEPSAIEFVASKKNQEKEYSINLQRVVGNVALVPIKKGEQLSLNKITEPNMRTGLAPQVAPGKRAMTVSVDETSSVGKLIKPGDRVDIIAVIDTGGGGSGRDSKIAKTILQDTVVLAVGRYITNNVARKVEKDSGSDKQRVKSLTDYDGYSSITVEVDPTQALNLAAITGGSSNRLIFTLRNNDDTDRTNLNTARATDVLTNDRLPAATGPMGGGK